MRPRKKPAVRPGRGGRPAARKSPSAEMAAEPGAVTSRRAGKTAYRTRSARDCPRYAGVPTFLRLPLHQDLRSPPPVDVLLTGVPLDDGVNHRPGARLGPGAVREASALAHGYSAALGVDIFDELQIADGGDIPVMPGDLGRALEGVAEWAEAVARSGMIGGYVGGDQTVTLGVLRGIRRAKLQRVGLLHLDARCDAMRDEGSRDIHHESAIRHAVSEGLVVSERALQIGIRGPFASSSAATFAVGRGFEIVTADDVKRDLHGVIDQLRSTIQKGPVYVSVDVAVLDPAYAPGTGSPAPGGLTTWELQQLLRALVGAEVVGFDVVEIAPQYDPAHVTGLAGVAAIHEILAAIADTRRSARSKVGSRRGRGRRVSA